MKRDLSRAGFLTFIGLAMSLLLASCSDSQPQSVALRIGTGSLSGNYDDIGTAFARLVRQHRVLQGYELQTAYSDGSVANIEALEAGEYQFGIVQSDHQYRAVTGVGEWATGARTKLRSVFGIYPEYVTIVAGADTDIESLSDLRAKIVDIGTPDSGTQRNAIDVLGAAGIDWGSDIQPRQTGLDDRLSTFMHGDIDAFFYTTGHPSQELKFASISTRGIRLLPLEDVDELVSKNPFYSRATIPTASYRLASATGGIQTVGVVAVLLTSESVPEAVVYALTKVVLENLDSLQELGVSMSALQNGEFLSGLTVPLHAGAQKYYDEVGVNVPTHLRSVD